MLNQVVDNTLRTIIFIIFEMMPAPTFLLRQHVVDALERLPYEIQEPYREEGNLILDFC